MSRSDGPTALERFIGGILPENPTYRQVLGICPTLAVSNGMKSAFTMAGSVMFVLVCSNLITSLIRPLLKPHLRILVFTLIIAAFVTLVDRFLAAYMYAMSKQLGPYVPLIIVNCIIICRCEVCAAKQGVGAALADAVGQSVGFALGLASIATVREILGSGSWFGIQLLPDSWPAWVVMILPPGAFITLGLLMGTANWTEAAWKQRRRRRAAAVSQPAEPVGAAK
jgi:electron transport complex protein RnfE